MISRKSKTAVTGRIEADGGREGSAGEVAGCTTAPALRRGFKGISLS